MNSVIKIELPHSQKINLSYTEIASLIRKRLKLEFPECKFSVTKKTYSGGGYISISLMKAPFDVFKAIDTIFIYIS